MIPPPARGPTSHGPRQAATPLPVDVRLPAGRLVPSRHGTPVALMDDGPADDPFAWVRGEIPPGFERRVITIAPGAERAYDEAEWRDTIVVVARGDVELEARSGARHRFTRHAVLWLVGVPLRSLHNPGTGTTVLVAVRRR